MEYFFADFFGYVTYASLIVFAVSFIGYCWLIAYGHRLPTKWNFHLQDIARVGMSFIFLALAMIILKYLYL